MFKYLKRTFWGNKTKGHAKNCRPQIYICDFVISQSVTLLGESKDEISAHEGILYWAGKNFDDKWFVTTCIAPQALTTPGSYQTSAQANAEVIKYLAVHRLEMLGQIHSHPGDLVDHSKGDDRGALMPYENFLSIVVPYYASQGILPLNQCGVHRYQNKKFIRLSNDEIRKSFWIVPQILNLRSK